MCCTFGNCVHSIWEPWCPFAFPHVPRAPPGVDSGFDLKTKQTQSMAYNSINVYGSAELLQLIIAPKGQRPLSTILTPHLVCSSPLHFYTQYWVEGRSWGPGSHMCWACTLLLTHPQLSLPTLTNWFWYSETEYKNDLDKERSWRTHAWSVQIDYKNIVIGKWRSWVMAQ